VSEKADDSLLNDAILFESFGFKKFASGGEMRISKALPPGRQ